MGVKIKSGLKKNWGKNKQQVEKKNLGKKKWEKVGVEKKVGVKKNVIKNFKKQLLINKVLGTF